MKTLGWMFLIFASFVLLASPVLAQSVAFDDSSPTLIVLGNSSYEIGLRKTNGSLAYILDKATGQVVSAGSRYECLWGAYGTAGYVGGYTIRRFNANLRVWMYQSHWQPGLQPPGYVHFQTAAYSFSDIMSIPAGLFVFSF